MDAAADEASVVSLCSQFKRLLHICIVCESYFSTLASPLIVMTRRFVLFSLLGPSPILEPKGFEVMVRVMVLKSKNMGSETVESQKINSRTL